MGHFFHNSYLENGFQTAVWGYNHTLVFSVYITGYRHCFCLLLRVVICYKEMLHLY